MRIKLAAIAAVLCCAPAAHAGSVTVSIDFASLAADAGRTITTTFDENGFAVTLRNATIVGPGDPHYTGTIGVIPAANTFSLAIATTEGEQFGWISIAGTFAAGSGTAVNWAGRADFFTPTTLLTFFAGSAPGTLTYTPGGAHVPPIVYPTMEIDLNPNEADAQLTGLSLELASLPTPPTATPEPPTGVLGGLAALAGFGWLRIRGVSAWSAGRRSASRR